MPSDVIKANSNVGLATAYPAFDMHFKATWGPHIALASAWHPFGGAWMVSGGAVYRQLTITGNAASPLLICSIIEAAKEPPCGNDQAALKTRNELQITAAMQIRTIAARAATGWLWEVGDSWLISSELGVFRPLSTKISTNVDVSIVAPDGTPENLTGALAQLQSSAQSDLESKAEGVMRPLAERTLPVLTLGASYRF